jgi:lysine-N-methylase
MPILHRTRTLPALMPRYVERFRCLGSSCEDTCCSGWSIHIDKKTYKAYRQNTAPELSKLLAKNLVRDENAANSAFYATIRPEGEAQNCPLMQGGLCSIHKHLGESHLSDLCFTYPRVSRLFNGQLEHTLTLSCPEAARQALLAEDAFEFIEDDVTLREATVLDAPVPPGMTMALMNDVRIFCLNLLRTRELPLWQRLAVLGTFCGALSRLCADGQQAGIPALIEDIVRLLENGELLASLDAVQPNYAAQAMVFSLLWSSKGFDSPSPYQQNVIRQISAGLGADASGLASGEALTSAYMRGLGRLDEALRDAPYLLENYLANEMFLRLFPFETNDAYDGYLRLVARFGLLRLLLAAQCNTDATPSPQTLIATVHLHCRRFQHDNAYTTQVNQALQGSGWADLERLNSLIKT